MNGLYQRALETKQPLEVIYLNDSGSISQRMVTVLKVTETHIKVYCHLRKQSRTFKKANILSAAPYRKYHRTRRAI